ncbi:aminodeoxychorismate lyase [Rathayibacter sp. YIM 133350]|uniref:aminodeoxychorismate lyase n=1 Tax=Rathayibacter sp. YIM 133350 TaxID=3131992 RepID=UPI00307CD891
MTLPLTLILDPLPADATDVAGSFREVDASAPALRVGELSTQRGDGIFETIAIVDGHAQEREPHLARLARSAEICDLPAPNPVQWRAAIDYATANVPQEGELAMKIVLSRGVEHGPAPTAWLTVTAAADFTVVRGNGIRVITLDRGYDSGAAERAPWLLLGAKTLSYAVNMAALREAKRRGADDTIFLTSDGYVMEGPTSSVIARIDGVFTTPRPSGSILAGTTQASLFEYIRTHEYPVAERDVTGEELRTADAIWLVSSVRLAAPVIELDGMPLAIDREPTDAFTRYLLSPRD